MNLFSNRRSPFARKVRVVASETGLTHRIDSIEIETSPGEPNPQLLAVNPLGKLPALVSASGKAIYDSAVICEYLDTLAVSRRVLPTSADGRIECLRREALADGLLDVLVGWRYELLRPWEQQVQGLIAGNGVKLEYGLKAIESEVSGFSGEFMLDEISVACALGYLDFRFPQIPWRKQAPRAAKWFARVSERDSMQCTVHVP